MNNTKNPYRTYGTDKIAAPNKSAKGAPTATKTVGKGDLRGGKKQ
jgi:hypothetical protein